MADLAANARNAYDLVRDRAWIDAGLRAGTDLGPLSQTLRPIDTLNQAGLGWLSSYLQPHQETLDQLAGNAAVIRTFAQTWQTVATQVAEIQHRLAGSATADTAQWQGSAADKYRSSAAGLADAVAGSSTLSAAVASVANEIGEAAAAARRSVADKVADLVQQLIQQVGPAAAVSGATPQLITQATGLIARYQAPIADILSQLHNTITGAATAIGSTDIALGTTKSWLAEFVKPPTPVETPQTRSVQFIPVQAVTTRAAGLSPQRLRDITDDYVFNTPLRRFMQYHAEGRYPGQLDWSSDGCTNAFNAPAGWNFLPACQRHDFGYRNYKNQGRFTDSARERIDKQFREDMSAICSEFTGDANYTECQAARDAYYRAVRQFGGGS
jgi:hypothetical protein